MDSPCRLFIVGAMLTLFAAGTSASTPVGEELANRALETLRSMEAAEERGLDVHYDWSVRRKINGDDALPLIDEKEESKIEMIGNWRDNGLITVRLMSSIEGQVELVVSPLITMVRSLDESTEYDFDPRMIYTDGRVADKFLGENASAPRDLHSHTQQSRIYVEADHFPALTYLEQVLTRDGNYLGYDLRERILSMYRQGDQNVWSHEIEVDGQRTTVTGTWHSTKHDITFYNEQVWFDYGEHVVLESYRYWKTGTPAKADLTVEYALIETAEGSLPFPIRSVYEGFRGEGPNRQEHFQRAEATRLEVLPARITRDEILTRARNIRLERAESEFFDAALDQMLRAN